MPDSLDYVLLEHEHDDYSRYKGVWTTIDELREGATAILANIEYYLERRPDEDRRDYQSRLKKFAYTPVLSTTIRETASTLASSPVYVSVDDLAQEEFWAYFKEHNDSKHERDEHTLLQEIFLELLYFGKVSIVADRNNTNILPRSQAEETQLELPYLNVYPALSVTDWGDDWSKTRQIIALRDPEGVKYLARWTYYLRGITEVYEAPVIVKDGAITQVWNGVRFVSPRTKGLRIVKLKSIVHGLPTSLMTTVVLPAEMWIGHMVYLKQIQHMRIESGWTDSGTLAGTIQRVFTPTPPTIQDNPNYLMEAPEYDSVELGNRKVLIGGGFQFVESSGAAIRNLSEQLTKIEQQIRAIVSMKFASVEVGAIAQSGASKAADMDLMNRAMRDYGRRVAALYQDALQNISRLIGFDPESLSVQGLDSFGEDTLQDLLLNGVSIDGLSANIPLTALRVFWLKVAKKIAGTVSPMDDEKIVAEANVIFSEENNTGNEATGETYKGQVEQA